MPFTASMGHHRGRLNQALECCLPRHESALSLQAQKGLTRRLGLCDELRGSLVADGGYHRRRQCRRSQQMTLAGVRVGLQALHAARAKQARGNDAQLDGLASPIPLAADESCTDRSSLVRLRGRNQVINIKLDKCGGLSEALALADAALAQGFQLMVGNMCGTSPGMAPAFLVAKRARWADLDEPLLQLGDRMRAMQYGAGGEVFAPFSALWG
jgi:hypothetical protein